MPTPPTPLPLPLLLTLYRSGTSYRALGDRYGTSASTIRNRLMEYVNSGKAGEGVTWPVRVTYQIRPVDVIDSTLIRAEIVDCVREYRISQTRLGQVCGWRNGNFLHQVVGGFKPRITRASAEKIMRGIAKVESGRVKWDPTEVILPKAVRDVCSKGHRYTGRIGPKGRQECVLCMADKNRRRDRVLMARRAA